MMATITRLEVLQALPWLGIGLIVVQSRGVRKVALGTSVVTFWVSVSLWQHYDISGVSLAFVVLTTFLTPISVIVSWESIKEMKKEFYGCVLATEGCLIGAFTADDLIRFFIFFEAVLIPMYMIVGVWGGKGGEKEKVKAAYQFFLYTLAGSVLMLLGIMGLYAEVGSTDYRVLLGEAPGISAEKQRWIYLGWLAAFGVKLPLMPWHGWLAQAHVEAPVAGSVLLAGVLLKLGGYGLIVYSEPLLPIGSGYWAPGVSTLGVIGVIYGSVTAMRQTDLKRIIAYSSVSHMGLVALAIKSPAAAGFMMVAHGLTSSALFISVTYLYERAHTRVVRYFRGVAGVAPLLCAQLLIFSLANLGLPLTANFIGELMCLVGISETSELLTVMAGVSVILSAAYSLFLYNRVAFGPLLWWLPPMRDIRRREWAALMPLTIGTIGLGLRPNEVLGLLVG